MVWETTNKEVEGVLPNTSFEWTLTDLERSQLDIGQG